VVSAKTYFGPARYHLRLRLRDHHRSTLRRGSKLRCLKEGRSQQRVRFQHCAQAHLKGRSCRPEALGVATRHHGQAVCFDEKCVSVMPNSRLSNGVFVPISRTQSPALYSATSRRGLYFSSLSADVRFTPGKVSFFRLMAFSRLDYGPLSLRPVALLALRSQRPDLRPALKGAYIRRSEGCSPAPSPNITPVPLGNLH